MRVLLIDDNHDLVDVLQMILETEAYEADCAYDYDTAIELLETKNYDVLFIDAKLPQHNGFDIFHRYRNIGGKGRIVIMTAFRCEQLIDYLISPERISLIHKSDKLDIPKPDGSTMVQLVISDKPKEMEQHLVESDSRNYKIIHGDVYLDQNENIPTHIIINTSLTVMENILLIYRFHKTLPGNHYSLLVDDSQYKHPFKEFSSCGCLLKPFEPEDMLNILEQISISSTSES